MNKTLTMKQVYARLALAFAAQAHSQTTLTVGDAEESMRPYKPKTPAQLRRKTDPSHRMMREAYKRRNGTDKTGDTRYRKMYYRKNKSQLRQRQKRSTQLHGETTAGSISANTDTLRNWCYEYVWDDGLTYSLVLYGDRFGADCTAQRLGLRFSGELIATYPVSDEDLVELQYQLPLAHLYENNQGNNPVTATVYAGRAHFAEKQ